MYSALAKIFHAFGNTVAWSIFIGLIVFMLFAAVESGLEILAVIFGWHHLLYLFSY